ncbi:MAG: TauD/TfdA family dioxygenase [Planctomycetaceae bacterium]|nr:TauD/TfdA family dioxygenase [Planctomycetaceae bacterium]
MEAQGKRIRWSTRPTKGPYVWTASELCDNASWQHVWSEQEQKILQNLSEMVTFTSDAIGALERQPEARSFLRIIEQAKNVLSYGRGLFLFRGIEIQKFKISELTTLLLAVARMFGSPAIQNTKGDLIQLITDRSGLGESGSITQGRRGCAEMGPHTDSSNIVGLLCVRQARRGGETRVSSAGALFNELLKDYAHVIGPLCSGFYFDMSGKNKAGVSEGPLPVFSCEAGKLSCYYNKKRIEVGSEKARVALSEVEHESIERLNSLAMATRNSYEFLLEPGDLLLADNRRVLHSRRAYEDWQEEERKRLLLRVWIN